MKPIDLLAQATQAQDDRLTESGELLDPVFGVPTQYGTPYHALCRAVLATIGPQQDGPAQAALAARGLSASLDHVADAAAPPVDSHVDRATGSQWGINHRDFFWLPILATYRLLRTLDPQAAAPFAERIRAIDVPEPFRARPPSNWAMVWLVGEWWRIQEGLSPHGIEQFDRWLAEFFASHILVDQGLYTEPGLPNSYDLFARVHLAEMLDSGYDGAWADPARRLLETGLDRSLGVQLSDGALASAHRSTGQAWTDGAQVLFFTLARRHFESRDARRAAAASAAARRAYASLLRWRRPDGTLSPVYNVLPAAWRVGYERYTADAHYSNLALSFLARAILCGFDGDRDEAAPGGGGAGGNAGDGGRAGCDAAGGAREQDPASFVEQAPTFRALVHAGPYSAQVNAAPERKYDALGLVDVTFGPGRLLHFASPVRHMESGRILNLGMALRTEPGRSRLRILAEQKGRLAGEISATARGEIDLKLALPASPVPSRTRVKRALTGGAPLPEHGPLPYEISLGASAVAGISVTERTPGVDGYKTLLVPYLRDAGTGCTTVVTFDLQPTATLIRFSLEAETVIVEIDGAAEAVLDLPHGYESRRGLCGLVRVDLREPRDAVAYRLRQGV